MSSAIDAIGLLKKVEGLRKWQQEEQERLMKSHQDELDMFRLEQERVAKLVLDQQQATTTTTTTTKTTEQDNDKDRRLSTITELSPIKDVVNGHQQQQEQVHSGGIDRFDDQPIRQAKQLLTFEELIEQKLREDDANRQTGRETQQKPKAKLFVPKAKPTQVTINSQKPSQPQQQQQQQQIPTVTPNDHQSMGKAKKPFLKRGQGLKRYNPSNQIDTKTVHREPSGPIVALSKPGRREDDAKEGNTHTKAKPIEDSIGLTKSLLSENGLTKMNHRPIEFDNDDLDEFEVLEKYVEDHPSFRSSASFVENLFPTIIQKRHHTTRPIVSFDDLDEQDDDDDDDDDGTVCDGGGCDEFSNNGFNSSSPIDHLNQPKENDEKDEDEEEEEEREDQLRPTVVRVAPTSNRGSTTDRAPIQRKIKRLHNTDDSLTHGFVHDPLNSQTHAYKPVYNSNTYKSQSQIELESSNGFDDDNTWTSAIDDDGNVNGQNILTNIQFSSAAMSLVHAPPPQITAQTNADDDDDDRAMGNVSTLMTKLFPSLKQQQQQQQQQPKTKANVQATTSGTVAINKMLNDKLRQLEVEIEKFCMKNDQLGRLKDQQTSQLKQIEKSFEEFQAYKDQELSKFNEYKESEMKKLTKEKKIFEQYQKSLKQGPTRLERDEIEKLKKQINDLNQEYKIKEQRQITNNLRLKDRCDSLEKENDQLKQELILIEKQRLEAMILVNNKAKLTEQQQQQLPLNISSNKEPQRHPSPQAQPQPVNGSASTSSGSMRAIMDDKTCANLHVRYSPMTTINKEPGQPINSNVHSNTNGQSQFIRQQSLQASTTTSPSITSTTTRSLSVDLLPSPTNQQKSVKFKLTNDCEPMESIDLIQQQSNNNKTICSPLNNSSNSNSTSNIIKQQDQGFVTKLIDNQIVAIQSQIKHDDGRVENQLIDGTIQTRFPNGTLKETNANKDNTYVQFYNGDYKHVDHLNHIETYYYAQTNVTQIKYDAGADLAGLQIFKFPNGQIEKHHVDNTKEILFPDKTIKYIYTNGMEETRLPNGTTIKLNMTSGHKIIEYPNKQREIHTQDYKRREYPDGSIKTVYSNGMSETRYANGRTRIKDELGNIISDTQNKT